VKELNTSTRTDINTPTFMAEIFGVTKSGNKMSINMEWINQMCNGILLSLRKE
jgi:hypothetical protein